MAEKENQDTKTPPEKTDGSENTDKKQEEHMIPKERFDAVNNRAKEAEAKLAALEAAKAEEEKKAMEEKGKFKELYEKEQAQKAKLEIEVLKRDLISEAITSKKLHPRLTKLVTGTTKEEIEKSIEETLKYQEEFSKQLKDDGAAPDNSGSGKPTPKNVMSAEEYMRLAETDPKEAERRFQETINANRK